GAIYLAMEAFGIGYDADQKYANQEKSITPSQLNHQTYNNSFTLFKRLYHDLKDTMHWVHDI
ncbi:MAG TPA: hypothetical protein VGI43_09245, partial [Mucilaginibacter sp.]